MSMQLLGHSMVSRTSLVALSLFLGAKVDANDELNFKTLIWPTLQKHCLRCHDAKDAQGGLRLDQKSWIEKGGESQNIVLGSRDDSELLRRLQSNDPQYRMPKEGPALSRQMIEGFAQWIESGAPWLAEDIAMGCKDDALVQFANARAARKLTFTVFLARISFRRRGCHERTERNYQRSRT